MDHCFTTDEREMLIRYCARFTHNWSLAEDLAQQALLEAWLKSAQLSSQEVRSSWLIGFARNVCSRWVRCQKRERLVGAMGDEASEISSSLEDDFDLEQHFERYELAQLLKKAIALLPPQTRNVLVQCYLEAHPQAEVAARLGITVGAVEARLTRGKQALHHLLIHELREEAASYGLATSVLTDWQHTHIWCPVCGRQCLLIRLPKPPGTIALRCPACNDDPEVIGWEYPLSNAHLVQYLAGLTQPAAILRRFNSWAYDYYFTAVKQRGIVSCAQCGQSRRLHLTLPSSLSEVANDQASRYGLRGHCASCGWQDFCSPAGLLQSLPVVQRFWREHRRMRLVFREQIEEVAGERALVAGFESITDAAQLDIVLAWDTLNLIAVHTNAL